MDAHFGVCKKEGCVRAKWLRTEFLRVAPIVGVDPGDDLSFVDVGG